MFPINLDNYFLKNFDLENLKKVCNKGLQNFGHPCLNSG
jgi:hypothetical protein